MRANSAASQLELGMATNKATFAGFKPYVLIGIEVTDKQLGHGSYGTVVELKYMGLKCAGKKIHEVLLKQGDNTSYPVCRFKEECRLLSQVRHPNIVQFLGVHFLPELQAPILVIELLQSNLTSCIKKYGILPKEINYSILHDVALGLCYLHGQTPPIVHRDLSSNNILLTSDMTAKISDLGVARILNLTPLQVSCMTQTPGTPAYMPPEVMVANPKYDTSIDEFSYGILMIHVFSGKWPEPQVGPNRTEPESDTLIPVTEAERREVFLQIIGNDHPLMDLIRVCINNNPRHRAHSREIVERLSEFVSQNPIAFQNKLIMLRRIQDDQEQKRSLREEGERRAEQVQQAFDKLSRMREELQAREEQKSKEITKFKQDHSNEIESLNLAHSIAVEQQHLQIKDLRNQLETMDVEKTAIETENEVLATQVEINKQAIDQISKHYEEQSAELQARKEEIKRYKAVVSTLETTKEAAILRMDSELEVKTTALQQNEAIISGLNEQLTRAREYLTSRQQVSTVLILN